MRPDSLAKALTSKVSAEPASSQFALSFSQLFRRFAAHLDNQAKKAPQLAEAFASSSGASATEYGKAEGSMAFLSRFRFLEVVGAGSYSTVHRAIEKSTGRPVAIKVIKKEILSPDVEAQILNEAVRVVVLEQSV